ncbi:hypothetical protein CCYS_02335 [Corynebacterium cystitidis DSM 20524]|uniref:Uncharacterized protein n=2 Tax=Corynebacterium cystitidis TaxID=35757 RepID=A0A1H9VJI4_9CORY|nr:hypothetical protein CCYS_02335 [Corynebacterium cystitidis DSM 20524]SES21946.1 hypothetical protein SAMN05661109_02279 [Corynebacterium cystitidis DSM 20524]SNV87395.1 Uncharacterised protein [Corynebacterium cystitidis]
MHSCLPGIFQETWHRGGKVAGMDDQTRQFGVPGRGAGGDGGATGESRPRQQFPQQQQGNDPGHTQFNPRYTDPGHDYDSGYGSGYDQRYEPYEEPYRPDDQQYYDPAYGEPKKKTHTGMMVLGILLALAVLAGIVMFLMWRSAAHEANEPPPPPVTVTQTETTTTTEDAPLIPTQIIPRDDQGNPQIPTEWPSDIPTTVPPEVSDGAQDAQDWLDGFLNDLESAFQ